MTTATVFPATLLGKPAAGSWQGGPQGNVVAFQPSVGPPITRRRNTGKARVFSATWAALTGAQVVSFEEWFEQDALDGSLPFAWTDPRTGEVGGYKIMPENPPYSISHVGPDQYDLSMSITRLPGVPDYAAAASFGSTDTDLVDLDFATGDYIGVVGGRVSAFTGTPVVTRATTARYWSSTGILTVAAVNEVRFQHDPVTGERLGLLREPAAANLVPQSEGTGTISDVSVDVSEGAEVDTGRGLTLNNITTTDNSGSRAEVGSQNVFVTNDYFIISAYVMQGSNISFGLNGTVRDADAGITGFTDITFDWAGAGGALQVVTGGFPLASGGGNINGAGVEYCGDGLWRCWIHGQITTAITGTSRLWPRFASIVTTSGATDALIGGGWQLEKVAGPWITAPSTYCKVGGGETGIRDADVFSAISLPATLDGPAVVLARNVRFINGARDGGSMVALRDAATKSRMRLFFETAGGSLKVQINGAGGVQLINLNVLGDAPSAGTTFHAGVAVNDVLTTRGAQLILDTDTYSERGTTNTAPTDKQLTDLQYLNIGAGGHFIIGGLEVRGVNLTEATISAEMEALLRALV